jgi:hypothetical protein
MVIRTDYILELIEQCTQAMLAAVGLKKAEEAEEELARAVSSWTGLDLDFALQLPTDTLLQMLGAGSLGAEQRLLLVGQAIALRCLVLRERGEGAQAEALVEKANRLIAVALEGRPDLNSEGLQSVLAVLNG